MARNMLGKLKPLKTDLIPPQGSVPAGVTADGKHQLWKRVKYVVKTEQRKDEQGNELWKRDANGQPLVRMRRVVEVQETDHLFYLQDHGNGNVEMVAYRFPTEEQKRDAERKAKVAAMQPALAEALVDSGLTVEEFVARVRGQTPAAAPVTAPAPAEPEIDYPVPQEDGLWKLSNGTMIEGDEDAAVAAELEVQEAREQAALVPES